MGDGERAHPLGFTEQEDQPEFGGQLRDGVLEQLPHLALAECGICRLGAMAGKGKDSVLHSVGLHHGVILLVRAALAPAHLPGVEADPRDPGREA